MGVVVGLVKQNVLAPQFLKEIVKIVNAQTTLGNEAWVSGVREEMRRFYGFMGSPEPMSFIGVMMKRAGQMWRRWFGYQP